MRLQDYIHYYIGCKIQKDSGMVDYPIVLGVVGDRVYLSEYRYTTPDSNGVFTRPALSHDVSFIKPVLRRLESMTEDEAENLAMIYSGADSVKRIEGIVSNCFYFECYFNGAENEILKMPKDGGPFYAHMFDDDAPGFRNIIREQHAFHYLLQNHFDLFGLINAGLAIEITP